MKLPLFYLVVLLFLYCSCQHTEDNLQQIEADSYENENYQKANAYLSENKLDSSFYYFDLASDEFLERGDSLNAATCLIQMAITLFMEGDYYGAQETSIDADRLLDKRKPDRFALMAYNYNNLANAISGYGDHESSIPYYDLAIQYASDSLTALSYSNNKAATLTYIDKYADANTIFERILQADYSSQKEYARALSNYANSKWHIDHRYNPLTDLHKALSIRLKENDLYGVNASYAHLYNYHLHRNRDSAAYYARKAYDIAIQLKSAKDKINATERLIQVSGSESSKKYFNIYKDLNDSVRMARLKASNQYAMIRYDAEKSKNENLQLQQEVLDKDLSLARQRSIVIVVIVLVLCMLTFTYHRYQSRKEQLKLEAENKINENKLKTSKKVHDIVANGIYRVMSELENREELDREDLLDKLEIMYERSRDISYDALETQRGKPFSEEIAYLLKSFIHENQRIFIIGNDEELWDSLSMASKEELVPIIQELLVNMRKHSDAQEVILKFEKTNHKISICYTDDGVGLPKSLKKGNGFENTGNRIEKLGGEITFDLEREKGTRIWINIPLT